MPPVVRPGSRQAWLAQRVPHLSKPGAAWPGAGGWERPPHCYWLLLYHAPMTSGAIFLPLGGHRRPPLQERCTIFDDDHRNLVLRHLPAYIIRGRRPTKTLPGRFRSPRWRAAQPPHPIGQSRLLDAEADLPASIAH